MQNERPPRTLILYSDYCCPFSYIAKVTVERYINTAIFPPKIKYRLFDLREPLRLPNGDLDWSRNQSRDDYAKRVQVAVDVLSEQRDVFIKNSTPLDVNSWSAQKAAYYIKENYPNIIFQMFHREIFRKLWREDKDIGKRTELKSVASKVGIQTDEIDQILDDDKFEKEFAAYLRRVKQSIPRATPTLVYQEQTISGAISLGDVRRLVRFAKGHPADEMGLDLIPHYMLPQHQE
jgi:predicted DsbA family dithiol-disulfide isomerase